MIAKLTKRNQNSLMFYKSKIFNRNNILNKSNIDSCNVFLQNFNRPPIMFKTNTSSTPIMFETKLSRTPLMFLPTKAIDENIHSLCTDRWAH